MDFLFTLCTLLFAATGGVVFLSYTIAWYEAANQNPDLVRERFAPRRLAFALRLLTAETLSLALTVVTHPLGWLPERAPAAGNRQPVLLLHGLFHNRSCWWLWKQRLRQAGIGPVYTLNLNTWRDLEVLTEEVAKKIDAIRLELGVERIDLIGHSMGGLIARNYVQIRGGAQKVRHCLSLGSPHHGSRLAPFALTPLGRLLMPRSDFLQRLAAAERPGGVYFSTIFSRHDNLIIPFQSAQLDDATQVELGGIGHSALLYAPSAFQAWCDILRETVHEESGDQQPAAG